jgi:hypothetical protein
MAYKYCTATNWGKNFFTHEERKQFHLSGQKKKHKLLLLVKSKQHKLLGMHYQLKSKSETQDQ